MEKKNRFKITWLLEQPLPSDHAHLVQEMGAMIQSRGSKAAVILKFNFLDERALTSPVNERFEQCALVIDGGLRSVKMGGHAIGYLWVEENSETRALDVHDSWVALLGRIGASLSVEFG